MSLFGTTIRNLPRLPTRQERAANKPQPPWKVCRILSLKEYLYFSLGFLAWMIDAFDFFSVSVTLTRLSVQFDNRPVSDITKAITLTLLFRSIGALCFGLVTDRFGRRWPLTLNLIFIGVLALGTAFAKTFPQFLAIRALFGIMMGGIYGMATATALENMPAEARGLFSGILQQGYAIGYLLAACINLSLVAHTDNWRSIFYIGSALSFAVAILRALCPESPAFIASRKQAQAHAHDSPGKNYFDSLKAAVTQHWGRIIFAILLMTGFNFFSHGSQDLYPTYAQITKGMTRDEASLLTIIGNCGAVVGGVLAGWLSQFLGRRLTIIGMCIWAAAFIPLWILPNTFSSLALGAFLLQFGVQGAWGVVPIYLSEIAPSGCLAIFTGLTYQIGNMISAASTEIEAKAAESRQVLVKGVLVDDYATVQAGLVGAVAGYIVIMICFGKEKRGCDLAAADSSDDNSIAVEESVMNGEEEKGVK